MNKYLWALVLVAATAAGASPADFVTRQIAPPPGAVEAGFGYLDATRTGPCLTSSQRTAIIAELAAARADLRARGLLPQRPDKSRATYLGWPLRAAHHLVDPGYHGMSGFVDHDAAFPDQLEDWNCGERTYDLSSGYNHSGTDYFTWPFSWHKMDDSAVEVVAAAAGTILAKHDGHFDRNCGFGGGDWNAVYVEHPDGSVLWYGHLKRGTLTLKEVGEFVRRGDYLGVVGSSGNSTGPHLHLEMHDDAWNLIDPYDGPCNGTVAESWWTDQRPYYDSAINALRTHDQPPEFQACPTPTILHEERQFVASQLVYFATYYRDQLAGQQSTYTILRPDDSVWRTWTGASTEPHYAASWWWWSWNLPFDAEVGWWTFRVQFEGQTVEYVFAVGDPDTAVPGAADRLRLREASPNPFNPSTRIAFTLPAAGRAMLSVHDARGRRVSTLMDAELGAGDHTATWRGHGADGRRAPAGVYFARLEFAGETRVLKLALVE